MDESKPSPRAPEAGQPKSGDNLVPDVPQNQKPGELNLRQLKDLLKDDKTAAELEKATGMSREQIEQFAKKFDKPPAAPSRPGEEIDVKSETGRIPSLDPKRKVGGPAASSNFSGRSNRAAGSGAQDRVRGNVEGNRSTPPPEIRARVEAYKSSLSRAGR